MKQQFPDFVCVGAARSGTTALWVWLDAHPQVHMSPVKETNFFSNDLINRMGPGDMQALPCIDLGDVQLTEPVHAGVVRDAETYHALMHSDGTFVCGEISPSYLYYADPVAYRIRARAPDCRIIILLREPVDRAISGYNLFVKRHREKATFDEAMNQETWRIANSWEHGWAYGGLGYYYQAVKTYIDTFGKDNVWIGLYESLERNPDRIFHSICRFIGVAPMDIPSNARINNSNRGAFSAMVKNRPGKMLARLVPAGIQRKVRNIDARLSQMAFRSRQSKIVSQLRQTYLHDVEMLSDLLPYLKIMNTWGYDAKQK